MFRRQNDLQPLSPDFKHWHWQKPIFHTFPQFFTRMESMDQPIYAGYGWKEIIRCMCEELRECLEEERERAIANGSAEEEDRVSTDPAEEPQIELDAEPMYIFLDLWDKYGELRIKSNPSESLSPECLVRISEIEDDALLRSVKTCVECGEPGRMGSFRDWLEVMCVRCAKGKNRDANGNFTTMEGVVWEDEDEDDEEDEEGSDSDSDDDEYD